jgi:hypothetical protein
MLGLAFRIAQSMAIDRDGELFKLKPFDTELRRRLWYQLLFLDLRAAETRGCLSTVLQYDTRPPTLLNDSDIFPGMTEYPKPATGLTEMTVPLMRFGVVRLGRRLQATGFRDTVLSPPAKRHLIEKVRKDLHENYMQYCQGAGPLYEYAAKVANMIISRANLVVYQDKMEMASQTDRDWLFNVCIQVMEFYQELSSNTTFRRWTWLLKIFVRLSSLHPPDFRTTPIEPPCPPLKHETDPMARGSLRPQRTMRSCPRLIARHRPRLACGRRQFGRVEASS